MTTYDLCTKLGKVLSQSIKRSLYFAGLLRTVRTSHADVYIKINEVHKSLIVSIEREKARSAKTIAMLQAGIDLIESTSQKSPE